jgi:hypothetical protein
MQLDAENRIVTAEVANRSRAFDVKGHVLGLTEPTETSADLARG